MNLEQSSVQENDEEDLQKRLMLKGYELMMTEEVQKQAEFFENAYGRPVKLEVVAVTSIPSIEIRDKEFDLTDNKGFLGQVDVDEKTTVDDVMMQIARIRSTIENYKKVMQDLEKK